MNYGAEIIGVGTAYPQTEVPNSYFEGFLNTSDEWIQSRTGIRTRRIADRTKGETTLSLTHQAAVRALEKAKVAPQDLDMIVIGTVTPESIMPCTANQLQGLLGAKKAFSFDLQAACSGFVYGLSIVDQYLRTGHCQKALVIGAETLSTIVNYQDRSTCVLFGDGAGAAVLQRTEGPSRVLSTHLYSDGSYADLLCIPHGYAAVPPYAPEYRVTQHKIQMKGSEVFKLAVRNMLEASQTALRHNQVTVADVNFFIFHQANSRILDMCTKTLGIDPSRTWVNVEKYGNTSAATLPACLDEAWQAGAVKKGDLILFATFGGGLTWASSLVRL